MTEEITKALVEWRDAREAIHACKFDDPSKYKEREPLWVRLGHAEQALMELARKL